MRMIYRNAKVALRAVGIIVARITADLFNAVRSIPSLLRSIYQTEQNMEDVYSGKFAEEEAQYTLAD